MVAGRSASRQAGVQLEVDASNDYLLSKMFEGVIQIEFEDVEKRMRVHFDL
jgi:hypothetical protein